MQRFVGLLVVAAAASTRSLAAEPPFRADAELLAPAPAGKSNGTSLQDQVRDLMRQSDSDSFLRVTNNVFDSYFDEEDAGDEIDAPAAAPSPSPSPSAEEGNKYQLLKAKQRANRRTHATTGLGARITDETDAEALKAVAGDGRAHAACGRSDGVIIAPYLQRAGSDRMTVRWRSAGKGTGVVCFGTSPEDMTAVARERGPGWPKFVARKDIETWDTVEAAEHQVHLTDLDPHTTYYYAIGSDLSGGAADSRIEIRSADRVAIPQDKYYAFTTFPEPRTKLADPVRVWAIGDSGWGDHKAGRVRDAFMNFTGGDWDLTLGLGDLAYLRGKDWEYQKRFFKFLREQNARVPVFTTPGNHDEFTSDMRKLTGPYFELFTNPDDGKSGGVASNHPSYYSFDYGPIHFVSVDSNNLGLNDDPELYAWLEKDLAAAQKADYDWIVAYHHQPPYSKGSHDSDAQYECYKLRQNLVPMFEKYGVDLVLAGHSHSYERSHLLNGHFGPSHEAATDPSVIKGRWAKDKASGMETLVKRGCGPHSGTVYIVTGGGAIRGGGPLDHAAMAYSQKNRGSTLLEFDKDELRIWTLGEHRDDKDDYAGFNKILDEAVLKKEECT